MTGEEKLLAAALLCMAADKFSNHGCNDFNLTEWIPSKETRDALVKSIYGEDEFQYFQPLKPDAADYRIGDYGLMYEMADKLRAG